RRAARGLRARARGVRALAVRAARGAAGDRRPLLLERSLDAGAAGRRAARRRGVGGGRAVVAISVIPPRGGEVIGDAPERRVEILADHDTLNATWSRFGPGR